MKQKKTLISNPKKYHITPICYVLIFITLLFNNLWAQNLVPNPSFETFTNCPLGPGQLMGNVQSWSTPDTASPDYYNSCYIPILAMLPSMDVPSNIQGYQNARTGDAYAGIISAENTFSLNADYREYIQVQLTSPLVTGTNYCIEFYWSLADMSPHYVQEIGVYLSSSQINLLQSTTLAYTPQLEQTGTPLDDTTNWVLFQQQYVATGGEEFIIIGNFRNPSNTTLGNTNISCNVLSTPSPGGCFAYYYIDDVSVKAGGACCTNTPYTDTQTAYNSYTWTDGITYTSDTIKSDTFTNVSGCDSIVTLNLTINSVNDTVTTNGTTLTASAIGASYQWVNCESNYSIITGENGQSYTATTNGSYAVIIDQNNCIDTSSCHAVISVNLLNNNFMKTPVLFPNPTEGYMSIDLKEKHEYIAIEITSLDGKVVSRTDYISVSKVQLNLQEKSGIYFIEIIGNKGRTARYKVMKL